MTDSAHFNCHIDVLAAIPGPLFVFVFFFGNALVRNGSAGVDHEEKDRRKWLCSANRGKTLRAGGGRSSTGVTVRCAGFSTKLGRHVGTCRAELGRVGHVSSTADEDVLRECLALSNPI